MTDDFAGFDEHVQGFLRSAATRLEHEFAGIHDAATVRAVVAESARQLSGGAVATVSFVPILAERFARERLRASGQAEGRLEKEIPEVVFVSLTGGGRAQIGAALLARRAGEAVGVHSAGSAAATEIDENVRAALAELGIDLSQAFTKPLSAEVLAGADVVVTMGRSVGEVEIPAGVRHVDWRVGDPAGAELDEVRRVRDDIARRIDGLAAELLEPAAAAHTS